MYSHIYNANKENAYGYSQKKKYITGRGCVDALSSVFNSLKASAVPTIRNIGSYVSNNKEIGRAHV